MKKPVVATVLVNRHENWLAHLPLVDLQKRSAEKFGHTHVLVTHTNIPGYETWHTKAPLPADLMGAILGAQLEYLRHGWDDAAPLVLLDVDVLVCRDLTPVFTPEWDIALTNRLNPVNPKAPINNGAMYFAPGAKAHAVKLFERAMHYCKPHWGGDQEAIARAVHPVPNHYGIEQRHGARIAFLSMLYYNCAPTQEGVRHKKNPFVVHFKGDRKPWMHTYAKKFVLV